MVRRFLERSSLFGRHSPGHRRAAKGKRVPWRNKEGITEKDKEIFKDYYEKGDMPPHDLDVDLMMRESDRLTFASEHEERDIDGIHLGDEYQHSRYRCPECHRGTYESGEERHCRVHGNVSAIDTNTIEGCKKMIEAGEDQGEPSEMEKEKFGGKTMKESWKEYFSEKKELLKGYKEMKEFIEERGIEKAHLYDEEEVEDLPRLKGMNVATKEELDRHGYKDPSDDYERFKKELIRQDREEEE